MSIFSVFFSFSFYGQPALIGCGLYWQTVIVVLLLNH